MPEVAERLELSERHVWRLLAGPALGEPMFRQATATDGSVRVARVVPVEAVEAYLAERGSGGSAGTKPTGGAGSGPKPTGPSK